MKKEPNKTKELLPHIIPAISLIALALLVYGGCIGHRFLLNWDDLEYVVNNEAVHGFSWQHLKEAFTRFYVGNYAPLHIVSYMLDYTLWDLQPSGFVMMNVVIHASNGILFYLILVRMGGRRLPAFIASFIFLFHPVQVESVAWISQRKTVLAMFFFLAAFYSYVLYREGGRGRRVFYAVSVIVFFFSLLSKTVTVILPPVLFLYDICFTEKLGLKRLIADKLSYILAATVVALIAVKSQRLGLSAGLTPHLGGSPLSTLFTMLPVLARYLGLLFLPADLSVLYMPPIKAAIDASVVLSGLLAVGLVIGGIFLYRFNRQLFFWYAFFFIGLLPVAQIVPLVTFFNDRYLYFPMLGAAALMGHAASFLLSRPQRYWKLLAASVLSLLLVLLPWLSWKRTLVWQDDLALWSDAVAKVPYSPDAWFALGMSYGDAGLEDEALISFLQVLTLDPDYSYALSNIGGMPGLLKTRSLILRMPAHPPYSFGGLMLLGASYYLTGDYEKAESAFRTAQKLSPQSDRPLRWLGKVYQKTGKIAFAREYYQKAAATGTDANLEFDRAVVEALANNPKDALHHMALSLRLGYKNTEKLKNTAELNSLRHSPEFHRLLQSYFPSAAQ